MCTKSNDHESSEKNKNKVNERYNLKIQGQVCHMTPNSLIPSNNEEPICGQLYIYDDVISIEKRQKANEKLIEEHLCRLTNILMKIHMLKIINIYTNFQI